MVRLRVGVAVVALAVISGVFLSVSPFTAATYNRPFVWVMWAAVVPLAFTVLGLLRWAYQARWVGMAIGIAILPLATLFAVGATVVRPDGRAWLALGSGLVLLVALTGPRMFEAFEGRQTRLNWSGARMGIARWTVITNIASVFSLSLYTAGSQMASFQEALWPMAFLLVVVTGVILLANQKTIGLLLLAAGCVGLLSAGTYVVVREGVELEGVLFIGAMFGPGIILALLLLARYAKPLLQHLGR